MESVLKQTNQSLLLELLEKVKKLEERIVTLQQDTSHIKTIIDEMPVRKDGWFGGYWEHKKIDLS